MFKIPFAKPLIEDTERNEIHKVLLGDTLTHGPTCLQFEKEFANFHDVKHAISTSNCTTALHLALQALDIKCGDEVIVPAMTHVATAHVVEHAGAKPIFVDIRSDTGCICPESCQKAINSKTKAIIVVHFVGLPSDMEAIMAIAKKNKLKVIEDSATALGAICNGKKSGTIGDIGCFSFYPTKHITSMEGGMAITNDDELSKKIKKMKAFGYSKNLNEREIPGLYDIEMLGWNYRMSEAHAAVGLVQLRKLNKFLKIRKRNAEIISKILKQKKDIINLIPFQFMKSKSSWYCINIILKNKFIDLRSNIIKSINKAGIQTSIHYPVALPCSLYYKDKYGHKKSDFPNAYNMSVSTISLPCGPHMDENDSKFVGDEVLKILNCLI